MAKSKRICLGPKLNTETHKWCNQCKRLLLRENYHKNKWANDGLANECKECSCVRKRTQNVEDYKLFGFAVNDKDNQWCPRCETLKPLNAENFYKNKARKTGFSSSCKKCDNEMKRVRLNQRRKEDPTWRLQKGVSANIRFALGTSLDGNKNSIIKLLPYTIEELREHLESQFEDWMTWDNYGNTKGKWNIDHIIPQSKLPYDSFQHPNFLRCWSLDNLRPLCSIANVKKSDKLTD